MAESTARSSTGRDTTALAERLLQAFHDRFGGDGPAALVARGPGRVNLLGGHTDYNDGFVLPTTIHQAAYVVARPRPDRTVRLRSLNLEDTATFALDDLPPNRNGENGAALPRWAQYVAGVTQEVQAHRTVPDGELAGFEALIYGDVPIGSGLSSSAALEVATAVALDALFGLDLDPVATARLCQTAEQVHVGVGCGIMDQFTARLGRAHHALFLDCQSLDHRHIPLPLNETAIAILDTQVSRDLAASKYNERRRECNAAVDALQAFDDDIETLRDVSPAFLDAHADALEAPLGRRARHVVTENRRVQRGADRLADGDLAAFGRLMSASHASLRDDYAVSSDELDTLVDAAEATNGVFGARMTGAGFGGCVVALARSDALETLAARAQAAHEDRFGHTPAVYVVEENLQAGVLAAPSADA